MLTIPIQLAERSYDVCVGYQVADQFGSALQQVMQAERLMLVTDEHVHKDCLPALLPALQQAGFDVEVFRLPAGESSKSLEQATRLWNQLIDGGYTRSDALLAVGGGVVSDLTGFVASSYMRGIRFATVPTSMMSQLDASIGGKTAINFPQAKNIVGAFYQPQVVLTDTSFLSTLPTRERSSGLAEAVKYGLLIGDDFFSYLEDHREAIMQMQSDPLTYMLETCIRFKAGLIEIDERDRKERMVLNLGHTLGHALEKLGGYGKVRHGEGVSVGLVFAVWLSERLGICTESGMAKRVESLLVDFQLPVRSSAESIDVQLETMQRDKKVCKQNQIRFLLLQSPGHIVTRELSLDETRDALLAFQSTAAAGV